VPLVVIVLAPLFGVAERIGRRRLLGLILGFVGVVALLGIDAVHGAEPWLGVGCVAIATVCYAMGSLVVQNHLSGVDELGTVAASLLVAAVLLLPLALVATPDHWPSTQAIATVIVLGIVCTSLGLFLYVYLIAKAGASRATIVTYINPAVAAALGVFVLNEHFGLGSAIGLSLILLGSWLGAGRDAQDAAAAGLP
jgi:drug/metabolite transporter (DMT)-like permease